MNTIMMMNTMTTADIKRPLEDMAQEEGPLTKKPRRDNRHGKRVHFSQVPDDDDDDEGSMRAPVVQLHLVPLVDDADMAAVWYSPEELHHSRRCDARWVRCYQSYCDMYKQQLFRVLGTACGKQSHSTEMNASVADSPIRGLERDMTPCFRLRKKQVVHNVLASQSALVAWNQKQNQNTKESHMMRLQGEQVLALHYHKLALPAMRFARLLAEGDAHVVANMI
jgi:hypothetical protein